jgi:hypothetical protein
MLAPITSIRPAERVSPRRSLMRLMQRRNLLLPQPDGPMRLAAGMPVLVPAKITKAPNP